MEAETTKLVRKTRKLKLQEQDEYEEDELLNSKAAIPEILQCIHVSNFPLTLPATKETKTSTGKNFAKSKGTVLFSDISW